MTGNGAQANGQGILADRLQSIAHAWDSLDLRVHNLRQVDGIGLRGVKLNYRGNSWLIILSAEVEGQRFVMFREASSSGDIGKVIRGMLEEPEWKKDKYAAE